MTSRDCVSAHRYCRLLGAFQEALTGELDGLGITQVPRIADLLGRYREVSGMLEEEHSMLLNSLTIAYGTPLQMDAARVAHEECINAGDEYELESRRYLDGLESQLRAEVKSPDSVPTDSFSPRIQRVGRPNRRRARKVAWPGLLRDTKTSPPRERR